MGSLRSDMPPGSPGWSHCSMRPHSDSLFSACFLHMKRITSRVRVSSSIGIVVKVPSISEMRRNSCEKIGDFW